METGAVARQAHGAIMARYGDTVVLATVLTAPPTRDIDFFPLYVDYREMQYAGGKVPGGFFKREGRPSSKEILTCRLIDRPIRPLFPEDFMNEVQVQCLVLSFDGVNDPDTIAVIATSAALALSPAPFQGPIGCARVGYIDGKHVLNPTIEQLGKSEMDLVLSAHADAVNMIELGGRQVDEKVVTDGIALGFEACKQVVAMIDEIVAKAGVKKNYTPDPVPQDLAKLVADKYGTRLRQAKQIHAKTERNDAISALRDELLAELCPEGVEEPAFPADKVKTAFYHLEGAIQRELILKGIRPDGRKMDQVRPLEIAVGILPRTHGSSLFARGETQALVTTTLGTPRDEQIVDGLKEEYTKKFMLHYNFPPFSVGEIRPIRGPGRREIGHGALAEKSLEGILPKRDDFPYTVRVVSDILESNGSTSMATVCGGSLSMMDAGVPVLAPVAGISIGMVSEGAKYVLLTDIIGEEDFHGDMDFKVAGTSDGVTALQMDIKIKGLSLDIMRAALEQARRARLEILAIMNAAIAQPRPDISPYAPRLYTLFIPKEKIGDVIGTGGKIIRAIIEETGCRIDIEDDGKCIVASADAEAARRAIELIEFYSAVPEIGKVYHGTVRRVESYGAFVEIMPGTDGLLHVSEFTTYRVGDMPTILKEGEELDVQVIDIDRDTAKVRLSRKVLIKGDPAKEAADREKYPESKGAGAPRDGKPRFHRG